jgi:hypothetical protein
LLDARIGSTDSRGARALSTETFTVIASRHNIALYVRLMTESSSVFTLPKQTLHFLGTRDPPSEASDFARAPQALLEEPVRPGARLSASRPLRARGWVHGASCPVTFQMASGGGIGPGRYRYRWNVYAHWQAGVGAARVVVRSTHSSGGGLLVGGGDGGGGVRGCDCDTCTGGAGRSARHVGENSCRFGREAHSTHRTETVPARRHVVVVVSGAPESRRVFLPVAARRSRQLASSVAPAAAVYHRGKDCKNPETRHQHGDPDADERRACS